MPIRAVLAALLLFATVARADDDAMHTRKKRVRLIAGVVTLAAGIGTLIGGAACLGIARATSDDLSHPTPSDHYDPAWWDYGRSVDRLGIALTTVGGAGTTAGIVVIVVGARF